MVKYDSYKKSSVEWIGEIPQHWDVIPLKNLSYMKGRIGWKGLKQEEFTDDGPYLITGQDIKNDIIDWGKCYHITWERYSESPEIMLQEEDLLFTKDGTIGKTLLIEKLPGPTSLNSHLLVIRPLTNRYLSKFLQYSFKSVPFLTYVELTKTGTTFYGVSQDTLENYKGIFPPLSEQTQIVQYLDNKTTLIDTLIQKTQEKINLLREKRTSLINHTVTKGLNPDVEMKDSGVEWIGKIPKHWETSKFKYHSEIVTGNTPSKTLEELYYTSKGTGYPWVKPTNLDKGFNYVTESDEDLTEEGKNLTRLIPKDSIMICSIGNTLGKYGISGRELSTNQQINSVICDKVSLNPRFCMFFTNVLTRDLINWTNFVTLPIFTKTDLEDTEIIVPPIIEQQQIVEYLDEQSQLIDTLIQKEEKRVELLKEYRQTLISDVVTGKIKVTDYE